MIIKRAASVYLPQLPCDLIRRKLHLPRSNPVLLKARDGQRESVSACCRVSAEHGITRGMSVAHARALLPSKEVLVADQDPAGDARSLDALARWAIRFTPRVMVDEPDGFSLDLTGCHKVYESEEALAKRLIKSVRHLGFALRLAIAPTFAAAWACARYAPRPCTIVADNNLEETVRRLPVEALQPDKAAASLLSTLSIDRVGQVMDLPRDSLPARFGEDFVLRLDQLLGHALEVVQPVTEARPVVVERIFAGPTPKLEAVMLAVQDCLHLLCQQLAHKEAGTRLIITTLLRSDLDPLVIPLEISRASRDDTHLWALLSPKVEKAHMGFGVEGVRVQAKRVVRLVHHQHQHWQPTHSTPDSPFSPEIGQVADTLTSRLGRGRVLQLHPRESHIPERSFTLVTASAATPLTQTTPPPFSPRPMRMLDHPRLVQVMLMNPDGPLMSLQVNGNTTRITTSIGPERIEPEWWHDEKASARDYFIIQLEDGRWLWVFREIDRGRWWLHGEWA